MRSFEHLYNNSCTSKHFYGINYREYLIKYIDVNIDRKRVVAEPISLTLANIPTFRSTFTNNK